MAVKTRAIQVRLTIEQHERLRSIAETRGFDTLAAYVRFAALDRQLLLEEKIIAIHRILLPDDPTKKPKRKPKQRSIPRDWE